VEWVVREGVGAGGEMNQALYAQMNNKRKMKKKKIINKKKKKAV
jgi:NaMN:DMB phosphoribosyltransferase